MKLKHQVMAVLNLGFVEVVAKELENCVGEIDFRTNVVSIDVKKSHELDSPIHTLVHEIVHFLHPKAHEDWVIKRAKNAHISLLEKEREWLKEYLVKVNCWED